MTPKRSTLEDTRSTLRDIIDRGEEVMSVFVEELTGSTSLREELEKTLRRATRARKTVDRNVEAVLGALNLPTRRDYTKLVEEIHSLQGAITNLNMKVDRLIATVTRNAESAPPNPSLVEVAKGFERSAPVKAASGLRAVPDSAAGQRTASAVRRLPVGKKGAAKPKKRAPRKRLARD